MSGRPPRSFAADEDRPVQFVCVGERRSRRAVQMGVRWVDGRLAASTLHGALRAIGLDPRQHVYLNVYRDDERGVDPQALATVRTLAESGAVVVGMGRVVQAVLGSADVPHLRLIHPAARGAIRARAAYQAHVAAVLGRLLSPVQRIRAAA